MYPSMKQGYFKIKSSAFTSASWVNVDLGFVPARIDLDVTDPGSPSSSSAVIGLTADFNKQKSVSVASTSVAMVNDLMVKKKVNAGTDTYNLNQWAASSTSNAVATLSESSFSSSSGDLVQTVKKGFKIAQALAAGDFKGKTIYYTAIPQNVEMYENLGEISDSDA